MAETKQHIDPRIATATSHWAHRFTANGVPLHDFQSVATEITQWDEWCAAWSRRGAVHEALAREALDAGYTLSAAEHYTRGGVCYHFGKFLFVHRPDELKAAHAKAVACRNAALPHLRPAGERLAIPFDGGLLYANFRKPEGIERPPVVVMCMGLDSAKEEMDAYAAAWRRCASTDRGRARASSCGRCGPTTKCRCTPFSTGWKSATTSTVHASACGA
jgi:hypothetical protein